MSEVPFSNADSATLKSEETRKQIVDAAAHLLSVQGMAATRLIDVVEYTQMQPAVTYYHFASFGDLVEEVLYCGITEMRNHVEKRLDALPPDTPPVDRLMVAVETHLRRELELSDYGSAWIRNAGHIPGGMTRRLKKEEAAQPTYPVFASQLTTGQARPSIPAYTALSTALATEINAALTGGISPSAALAKAAAAGDQAIASGS